MTCFAGSLKPRVIFAAPVSQPPSVRHSASKSGPAARWIMPSTPPPPSSLRFAALTMASTPSVVMSAIATSSRAGPTAAAMSGEILGTADIAVNLSSPFGARFRGEIDRAFHADIIEVLVKETPRRTLAAHMEHVEEVIVVGKSAVGIELGAKAIEHNAVNIDTPIFSAPDAARQLDLIDQDVFGGCGAEKRKDHRVAQVTAVPIGHAIDFDSAKQQRQAGGCHDSISGDFVAWENPNPAGLYIGRRDEQLQIGIGAQCFEINETFNQVLQRIDVERIDVIGRKIARQGIEPGLYRRALERRERQQPFHHRALERRQIAGARHRTPEIRKPLLRPLAPAAAEAVGKHDRIHGPRRSARNTLDAEPLIAEDLIEDTPGESAVGAPALQSKIDAFGDRRGFLLRPAGGQQRTQNAFHWKRSSAIRLNGCRQ